jgi:hypothetical protein
MIWEERGQSDGTCGRGCAQARLADRRAHGRRGLTQHRIANTPNRVHRFVAQLPWPARVAIEASGTWWWLADLLDRLGHQPVRSHPKHTKAITAARL